MIIVTAKITAKYDARNKIILKAEELIRLTRLESGCISYDLFTSTEDDNILLMFEKWENQDVLNSHMQTEHFTEFNKSIANLLEKNLEINVYTAEKISNI